MSGEKSFCHISDGAPMRTLVVNCGLLCTQPATKLTGRQRFARHAPHTLPRSRAERDVAAAPSELADKGRTVAAVDVAEAPLDGCRRRARRSKAPRAIVAGVGPRTGPSSTHAGSALAERPRATATASPRHHDDNGPNQLNAALATTGPTATPPPRRPSCPAPKRRAPRAM